MNNISVQSRIQVKKEMLRRVEDFSRTILEEIGIDGWEVSILLCGDGFVRELNKKYRNIDEPTDVLSFCQDEVFGDHPMYYSGDVVISLDRCRKQALENGVSENNELKKLLIHGILHLCGFDHEKRKDAEIMQDRENLLHIKYTEVRIV